MYLIAASPIAIPPPWPVLPASPVPGPQYQLRSPGGEAAFCSGSHEDTKASRNAGVSHSIFVSSCETSWSRSRPALNERAKHITCGEHTQPCGQAGLRRQCTNCGYVAVSNR